MPRPKKGPRLYLRERDGREPTWVILDSGGVEVSTGCGVDALEGAEGQFAQYLAGKHTPSLGSHQPRAVQVADVLTYYVEGKRPPEGADARALKGFADLLTFAERLMEWWGDKTLSDVKKSTCKDYVRHRTKQVLRRATRHKSAQRHVKASTARRELEVLRPAIHEYHAEYMLDAVPVVTLPPKAERRLRWLTRTEAAAAVLACLGWRWHKEAQAFGKIGWTWSAAVKRFEHTRDAKGIRKQVRSRRRHVARFLIIGFYSGTRHMGMVRARWIPSTSEPHIDVERGLFFRRGEDERVTSKRQPPVRIPPRLLAHLRRWRALDMAHRDAGGNAAPITHVLHVEGRPMVSKIRTAWEGMRTDAGLKGVTPHVLRHTSATWMMQGGEESLTAADYLGMSEEVLRKHYYHFHPDYQRDVGEAFSKARHARRPEENADGTRPRLPKKPASPDARRGTGQLTLFDDSQ